MANGTPLDNLIKNHFSSKDAGTAFGEQEKSRQDALKAGGSPSLDQLWEDHSTGRTGHIFAPPPMQVKQERHREEVYKRSGEYLKSMGQQPSDIDETGPVGPTRPYVAEEVPDIAEQYALPPAERRPELRTPGEHQLLKPTGLPLYKYLQSQGIPMPEDGVMPTKEYALKLRRKLSNIHKSQRDWTNTDVSPKDIADIPQSQRWYAAWLWRQLILKEKGSKAEIVEEGRKKAAASGRSTWDNMRRYWQSGQYVPPLPGEFGYDTEKTLVESTGKMKDAFHEFGIIFGLGDPEISTPNREFARYLDDVRDAADVHGIRPKSMMLPRKQGGGRSIFELIEEGRWGDVRERGIYGATGMVPDVAATVATAGASRWALGGMWGARVLAGSASATGYWYARSLPDIRRELIQMGIEEENATIYAAIAAVPYAAIEQLQIRQFTGPMKEFARHALKAKVREIMLRQGGQTLKLWALEEVEEGGQAGVQILTLYVASKLAEKDPNVPWAKLLTEKGRELQEAAVTIPFLIGPRQATSLITDFVDNPSRVNWDALPDEMKSLLGDATNPDDPASKQSVRELEADRLKEQLNEILNGFAYAASENKEVRSRAGDQFEGQSPTEKWVSDNMTSTQSLGLFGVPNPTQETIDTVWKRQRDRLRQISGRYDEEGSELIGTQAPGYEYEAPATEPPPPVFGLTAEEQQAEEQQALEELGYSLEDLQATSVDWEQGYASGRGQGQKSSEEDYQRTKDVLSRGVKDEVAERTVKQYEEGREVGRKVTEKLAESRPSPATEAAAEPAAEEPAAEVAEVDLNALRSMTPEEAQGVADRLVVSYTGDLPLSDIPGLVDKIAAGEATVKDREQLKKMLAGTPSYATVMIAKLKELRAAAAAEEPAAEPAAEGRISKPTYWNDTLWNEIQQLKKKLDTFPRGRENKRTRRKRRRVETKLKQKLKQMQQEEWDSVEDQRGIEVDTTATEAQRRKRAELEQEVGLEPQQDQRQPGIEPEPGAVPVEETAPGVTPPAAEEPAAEPPATDFAGTAYRVAKVGEPLPVVGDVVWLHLEKRNAESRQRSLGGEITEHSVNAKNVLDLSDVLDMNEATSVEEFEKTLGIKVEGEVVPADEEFGVAVYDLMSRSEVVKQLSDRGYDAILVSEDGEQTIAVLDRSALSPAAAKEPAHELYAPDGIVQTALKLTDQGKQEEAESLLEDNSREVLAQVKDRINILYGLDPSYEYRQIDDDIEDLALLELKQLRDARHYITLANPQNWRPALVHLADATDFAAEEAASEKTFDEMMEEMGEVDESQYIAEQEGLAAAAAAAEEEVEEPAAEGRELVADVRRLFDELGAAFRAKDAKDEEFEGLQNPEDEEVWQNEMADLKEAILDVKHDLKIATAKEAEWRETATRDDIAATGRAAAAPKKGTKAAAEESALEEEDDDIDDLEDDDDLANLLKDLHDEITGPGAAALGLNDEVLRIAGKISVVLIKKGVKAAVRAADYTFKKFSRQFLAIMAKQFGADTAAEFKDQLVGLWAGALYRPETEVPPEELGQMTQPQEAAAWAAENIDATIAAVKKKYAGVTPPPVEPAPPVNKPEHMLLAEYVAEQANLGVDQEKAEEVHRDAVRAAITNGEYVHPEAAEDHRDLIDVTEPHLRDPLAVQAELDEVNTERAKLEDAQMLSDTDPNAPEPSEQERERLEALYEKERQLNDELNDIESTQEQADETLGTRPPRVGDREDLDQPEPEAGEVTEEEGAAVPAAEGEAGGGGVDVRDADDEGGVAAAGGEELGDAGIDPAAAGDAASQQPDRPGSPGTNHRIRDEDNIGIGTPGQKFDANLAAIETLQRLEREGRQARPAEKRTLAKYVGWGGMPLAFDQSPKTAEAWKRRGNELRELLKDDKKAYDAAEASVKNAHYTSSQVIQSMWNAVKSFGFTGGKVLEPSMGVGHFFGMMPADLASNTQLVGVELDSITGRIAEHLYENAVIHKGGFEKVLLAPEFDLVIGNVPFGPTTLVDRSDDETLNVLRRKGAGGQLSKAMKIHNFFFAKSLMKTRPGGLIVMLSSTGTLDSTEDGHIDFMKENGADLVGAIRLPGIAFKDNANTGVTTDILIFQKTFRTMDGGNLPGREWGGKQEYYATADGRTSVKGSPYWNENGGHIIGDIVQSTMRGVPGDRMGVAPEGDNTMEDYKHNIDEAFEEVAKRIDRVSYDLVATMTEALDNPETQQKPLTPELEAMEKWLYEGNYHVHKEGKEQFTLYQKRGGKLVEVQWDPPGRNTTKMPRLIDINNIRDAARVLREAEKDPELSDEAVEKLRGKLNEEYDAYIAKWKKPLNDKNSFSLKMGGKADSSVGLLLDLEVVKKNKLTKKISVEKAKIFSQRQVFPTPDVKTAETPTDALALSLAERGMIDWEYMSELMKIPVPDLQLALSNILFKNPIGEWESVDTYLGGNVRTKLAVAVRAAETDSQYNRNVAALVAVQPQDWSPNEIDVNVGESWIPAELYDQFVAEIVDPMVYEQYGRRRQGYFYIEQNGKWGAEYKRKPKRVRDHGSIEAKTTYGTSEIPFDTLMLKLMNGERINVNYPKDHPLEGKTDPAATAQAEGAARLIQDRFVSWLWSDREREADMARIYNDLNNNWAQPVYDGSHLRLPGMAEQWKLRLQDPKRRYQKDNIWRMIVGGNTLLAHAVGAGKTVQMIAAAMEMRRLGLKRMNIFCVPGTLHAQWEQDIMEIYPNAKVLVPKTADLGEGATNQRDIMLQRMLHGDWDIILMTPESYESIPMSEKYVTAFLEKEVDDLRQALHAAQRADLDEGPTVKGLQQALTSLEEMMHRILAKLRVRQETGGGLTFDELGVDALFVDEAHQFKNLFAKTRMARIPGIQTKPVDGPFDMYMKTAYLNKKTNGRGVYFATATPITNTMGEMHVMMRYLAPRLLEERGIVTFDQWAKRYGVVETKMEVEVAGQGVRENTRFSRFQNVGGLKQIWLQFADTKLRSDLDLKLPSIRQDDEFFRNLVAKIAIPAGTGGAPQRVRKGELKAELFPHILLPDAKGAIEIAIPISDEQQVATNDLIARTHAIRGGGVDPEHDNMLAVATDGRKIATDMRLMDPEAEDHPESKTNVMIGNVLQVHERTSETTFVDPETGEEEVAGGVQVLWVDRGVPGGKGFNLYEDIKNKLVLNGVAESEIAFIQDYDTPEKKIPLFKDLNDSTVRIIIASTESLSVGANIQRHLIAAHHLDAPWRPADVEQRDGRIIRPGNFSEFIEIYRYVTEKTFDAFMWSSLARKWSFLMDFYKGDTSIRHLEDVGESVMSPDEMLAIATGDPRIARLVRLQAEVQDMDRQKAAHDRQIWADRQTLVNAKAEHATAGVEAAEHKEAAEYFAKQRALLPDDHPTGVEFFVKSEPNEDGSVPADGSYSKPGEAGQALIDWLLTDLPDLQLTEADITHRRVGWWSGAYDIGSIFGMTLHYSEKTAEVFGSLPGATGLKFSHKLDHKNPYTAFQSIWNKIKGLSAESSTKRDKAAQLSKDIKYLEGRVKDPEFPKLNEWNLKTVELSQLQYDVTHNTPDVPEVETVEGVAGEAKMQQFREEASALENQRHLLQEQVDEWGRVSAAGTAGPMSPYRHNPITSYYGSGLATAWHGSGPRPRGSQLQPTKSASEPLTIPEQLKADHAPAEARMQEAHGVPKEKIQSILTGWISYAWRGITRAETEIKIPTVLRLTAKGRAEARAAQQEIAPGIDYFRLLKNVGNFAEAKAIETIRAITGELDREHFWIFERYVIVMNQLRALDLEQPRRHGWETREQIEQYKDKLDAFIDGTDVTYRTADGRVVQSDGMPNIRRAIDARNSIIRQIVVQQVDLGLEPADILEAPEHYFHQQIVELVQAVRVAKGSRQAKPVKRSYQHKRVGVDVVGEEMPSILLPDGTEVHLDPNTDYLQAELTWMTEAFTEAHKKKMFEGLDRIYGKKKQLKREAKRLNHVNLVGGEENLQRVRHLEHEIAASLESPDAKESDQLALRKGWRNMLYGLDPSYEYRQKKGLMRKIVEEETDVLDGVEGEEDFFWEMKKLSLLPIGHKNGVKAALGFLSAINQEREMYKKRLGIEHMTWEKVRRRDHPDWKVYSPENSAVYKAYKIPEKALHLFQKGIISEIVIKDLDIDADEVMVLAGPRAQYVFPEQIINELVKLEQKHTDTTADDIWETMVGHWKQWVLLNPKRAFPYNFRNFTGDFDPIIAAAPGVVLYLPKAVKQLYQHYKVQKGEDYTIPPEIALAIEYAVIASGVVGTELPNTRQIDALKELYREAHKEGSILNPVLWGRKYFRVVRGFSEFRENMLRHAAFLYALDNMKAGKKLKHYGASRKHIILGIQKEMGDEQAAARWARELLGDYSNMTALGDWLARKGMIPFQRFTEINAKRYPMLMLNAFSAAKTSPDEAASLWGVASGGITMAVLSARIGAGYGAYMLFNMMVFGDDEDELPPHEKRQLHINLGRDASGRLHTFRNVGALGDALEWLGLNELHSLVPMYKAGQIDGTDLIVEMAKSPLNKLINGFGPLKTVVEVITGYSTFPDVTNIRPVDRDDHAMQFINLKDEYRWTKGMLLGEGDRARPHYFSRWSHSVNHPGQAALSSIYELRDKFLEQKGEPRLPTNLRSAIRKMKYAAMNEDYAAFKEAKAAYLKSSPRHNYKSFSRSLGSVDPLDRALRNELEIEFEKEFLTGPQRKQLRMARDYAQDIRVQMWQWWKTDAKEKKGEVGYGTAVRKEISAKLKTMSRGKPVKRAKQGRWHSDQKRAAKWLKERGYSKSRLINQYEGTADGRRRVERNLKRLGIR